MSAGFDACNLNPTPLEFISGTQNQQPAVPNPQLELQGKESSLPKPPPFVLPKNLQRVAKAREQQGFSLRTIARRTGIDLRTLRTHELPTTDLKLSELRAWQLALEVPLVDLVEDDLQPLSSPVKDRAMLVRIMKTVVAIKEAEGSPRVQRLSEMLFNQMVELMPELKEIGAWPQHGSRRNSGNSRIIEQQVNTNSLGQGIDD